MPQSASEPGVLAGSPAAERHGQSVTDQLRRRHLGVGLAGGAVVAALGALNPATPAAALPLRAALLAFCLAGLLRLRRGGELARLGQAVAVVFTGAVLTLALARLDERWPLVLADLPAVLVFSMLLAGPRLAVALAAGSVGIVVTALLLPGAPTPAHLGPQLYGLLGSLVFTTLYFQRFAALVAAGARELSASVEALEALRREVGELAQVLSRRVAGAVDGLSVALRDSPAHAQDAAEVASLVLTQSKRRIPPAPEFPDEALGERLEALRQRAMDLSIVVLLAFDVLGFARMVAMGPRENIPVGALGVGSVLLAAMLRWWRPGWRRPVTLGMWLTGLALSVPLVWGWYARAPVPPPPLTPQLVIALFIGALYGPRLAWGCLAAGLAVNLGALALHPGIVPADVVGVFVVYALATWVVWSWPRELLEALRLQRLAAAESIRERRRLVATLLHDLANPMMVVSGNLELAALGRASPDLGELLEGMVRRMQASLAAAISGQVHVGELEAGQLCDDVAGLFRAPLESKHVALAVSGPRGTRLKGDEALLRDSVLANLVSNAIKFSPEGGTVELTVHPEGSQVALVVEDRGPGLPAEVTAALSRDRPAPSRPGSAGEPGSGYGLLLARDWVTAMGGQLELAPRPGGGLSARVRLPAA